MIISGAIFFHSGIQFHGVFEIITIGTELNFDEHCKVPFYTMRLHFRLHENCNIVNVSVQDFGGKDQRKTQTHSVNGP